MAHTSTHTFKVADGLALTIDISKPQNAPGNGIVLIHFHGGFLVIGEKTTFPPQWLINACHARGWTYATASYRLMPEATGLEVLADALDAIQWVHQNISERIIIAGSSAGGYLALATASHPKCPRPIAVLAVYGMLDPASERYIKPGTPLTSPITDLPVALEEIDSAVRGGKVIDGYSFPASPPTDQRMRWIRALHQGAKYPDVLTGIPGLAAQIALHSVNVIPEGCRNLFPVTFGLRPDFPPTVLLHGDNDMLVGCDQSVSAAEKMRSLGIDVHFERAEGQGHGFEAKSNIDLDAEDAEGDDMVTKGNLWRVIEFLERSVAQSTR